MRVIAGSPDTVRAGADGLGCRADAYREHGRALVSAATAAGAAWGGPASLSYLETAKLAARGCGRVADQLAGLADAGATYAGQLRADQDELRRLGMAETQAAERESALRARAAQEARSAAEARARASAQPRSDPFAVALHQVCAAPVVVDPSGATLVEAERAAGERARLAAEADAVWAAHQSRRAAFVEAIGGADPGAAVNAVLGISEYQAKVLDKLSTGLADEKTWCGAAITTFRAAATQRRLGNPEASAWIAAQQALDTARESVGASPLRNAIGEFRAAVGARDATAIRAAGPALAQGVGARINLALTAVEGAEDLVHGEPDHPGWRDVATRIAGGAGAAGAGMLLASGLGLVTIAPVVAGGAMVLVGGYTAYKLATFAWDNRETITRVGAGVSRATAGFRSAVAAQAKATAADVRSAVSNGWRDLKQSLSLNIPQPSFGRS